MRTRIPLLLALAAVLALAVASLAAAEEVTRHTYKEMAEPICKSNTKANEKILKGVRAEVKHGKLKQAARRFLRAGTALSRAQRELARLPQPPADVTRLTKWLAYVKEEASLFKRGGQALKANKKPKAQTIVVKLTHNANLANNEVLPFGFHYCKLEPSKFT